MDIHERLKDNIALLMRLRGIDNVADLAALAKVYPNTIHNAVKLRYSMSLRSLAKVARALGVDVSQLLAPTALIDENMAGEIEPLIDDYRQADSVGRETIRRVASAQALAATHGSARRAGRSAE